MPWPGIIGCPFRLAARACTVQKGARKPRSPWMHSHVPVQERQLLAAPLIVRSAADLAADRQEVVLFLHDFSFRPAGEVLAEITGGDGSMAGIGMGATPAPDAPSGMDMAGLDMDLPNGQGAFPVLALREGAVERTGIILATAGGAIEKLAGAGEAARWMRHCHQMPPLSTGMMTEFAVSA